LNLIRVAIGNQCSFVRRGVMCALFGSLKTTLAAAFWISCRLIRVRPARRALQ